MIDQKIAYEKHPLSNERFEELRSQGFKVVDIKFKPKDLEDQKEEEKPSKRRKPSSKAQSK